MTQNLITRLSKLDAPDREVDALIAAIAEVYASLQEPTDEMQKAYNEYGAWRFSAVGYAEMLRASPLNGGE